jgi:DNA-directed RNA polymerase specialized sigma24 family protein
VSADRNAAFAELYEHTFDAVYRFCRLRIADPVKAEDAAALVFAKAFASSPSLVTPFTHRACAGSPARWMLGTVGRLIPTSHRAPDY